MIQESILYYTFDYVFRVFGLANLLGASFDCPVAVRQCADRQTSTSGPSCFDKLSSSLPPTRWVAKINASQVGKHSGMLIIRCSYLLWENNNKKEKMLGHIK